MDIHTVDASKREQVIENLCDALYKHDEILFAYLHGTFLQDSFRDIDIGVYLRDLKNKTRALRYEIALETELEDILSFPVDARIINGAPLSFRFNMIKDGMLLFSKDENKRSDFECLTFVEYHDFRFYRDSYRREAIGIGV